MLAAAILSAAAAAEDSAGSQADSRSKLPVRLSYQKLSTPPYSSPSSLSTAIQNAIQRNETTQNWVQNQKAKHTYIQSGRWAGEPKRRTTFFFCFLRSTPHLHRMVSSICRLFTSISIPILSCLLSPFVIRGLLHGVLSSSSTLSVLCLLCSALHCLLAYLLA